MQLKYQYYVNVIFFIIIRFINQLLKNVWHMFHFQMHVI